MSATKTNFEGTIAVILAGTVAAGDIGFFGDSFGMYMKGGGLGDTVAFLIQGKIKDAPKVGSQAWTAGDALYWDSGNSRFTKTYQAGTKIRALAAAAVGSGSGETSGDVILNPALADGAAKIARGQAMMTGATLTVVTGLAAVVAVVAVMDSDPILTCDRVTATIGDQAGTPAAGSVILKAWMPTDSTHTTPIAATGYANIKVNWIAIGS